MARKNCHLAGVEEKVRVGSMNSLGAHERRRGGVDSVLVKSGGGGAVAGHQRQHQDASQIVVGHAVLGAELGDAVQVAREQRQHRLVGGGQSVAQHSADQLQLVGVGFETAADRADQLAPGGAGQSVDVFDFGRAEARRPRVGVELQAQLFDLLVRPGHPVQAFGVETAALDLVHAPFDNVGHRHPVGHAERGQVDAERPLDVFQIGPTILGSFFGTTPVGREAALFALQTLAHQTPDVIAAVVAPVGRQKCLHFERVTFHRTL
ncbi:hypothetical protein T07_13721 [Trichinella nelsoni]|uniref:Uncharacterized protein n=1 Tax=Trichinella nelsoni TaxID=6336 RepID=A0A0V0RPT6_9BILA|nr:hypothetical protein T07_13721 [Trichinella nelsoni]